MFNFGKLIAYLAVVPPMIAAILKLVAEFETPGNGAAKKEAVMNAITQTFVAFEHAVIDTPLTVEDIERLANTLIDTVVGFYNAIGKFGKVK